MVVPTTVRDVYLDTSFVVNAVFEDAYDSPACLQASQLIRDQQLNVYHSVLLQLEFAQSLRRLATRRQVAQDLYHQFELDKWARSDVRHRWLSHGFELLDAYLLSLSEVVELPASSDILARSTHYMAEYALGSLDATHLATALHYELPLFWTCDDHFARVQEIAVEIIRDDPAQT